MVSQILYPNIDGVKRLVETNFKVSGNFVKVDESQMSPVGHL